MDQPKVLITTVPFSHAYGLPAYVNQTGKRLTEESLFEMIQLHPFEAMIAGTEPITARVMDAAPNLRLIARVGIGMDNVDLAAAKVRFIQVSYTPDAPALAVAELTIGMMLSLLRSLPQADRALRKGEWTRFLGRRLAHCVIGVIGIGRIGTSVIRMLQSFSPAQILVNDLSHSVPIWMPPVTWVEKEIIYQQADVITLHVPLTKLTKGMIGAKELAMMKKDAILINTSRGGIIQEIALAESLRQGWLGGAGLDVYEHEPYGGELTLLENCLLTCHMGSMSVDCRARMEQEAVDDVLRFLRGAPLRYPVPDEASA